MPKPTGYIKDIQEQDALNMKSPVIFPDRRLRDMPFKQSYKMYDDIGDLASCYVDEIITAFSNLITGGIDIADVKLLIYRAQYASYLKGFKDKEAGRVPGNRSKPAHSTPVIQKIIDFDRYRDQKERQRDGIR